MTNSNFPRIHILLSTYQGENFLDAQLNSLFNQSFENWVLWIRDDGSRDKTLEIIDKNIKKDPRVNFIKDDLGNLGPAQSFGELIRAVAKENPEYVMLCDQDDIWLPQKISLSLEKSQEQEAKFGKDTPILVHTDLAVVDKNLQEISSSFWKYQNLNPSRNQPCELLMQNTVTGCTCLLNQALIQKLVEVPMPKEAIMHDVWLALVASFFGKIFPVFEATMLYRQHGLNDIGAKKWSMNFLIKNLKNMSKIIQSLKRKEQQAGAFLKAYGESVNQMDFVSPLAGETDFFKRSDKKIREGSVSAISLSGLSLPPSGERRDQSRSFKSLKHQKAEHRMLQDFSTLSSRNFFMRRYILVRHGLMLQGWLRNLVLLGLI